MQLILILRINCTIQLSGRQTVTVFQQNVDAQQTIRKFPIVFYCHISVTDLIRLSIQRLLGELAPVKEAAKLKREAPVTHLAAVGQCIMTLVNMPKARRIMCENLS